MNVFLKQISTPIFLSRTHSLTPSLSLPSLFFFGPVVLMFLLVGGGYYLGSSSRFHGPQGGCPGGHVYFHVNFPSSHVFFPRPKLSGESSRGGGGTAWFSIRKCSWEFGAPFLPTDNSQEPLNPLGFPSILGGRIGFTAFFSAPMVCAFMFPLPFSHH